MDLLGDLIEFAVDIVEAVNESNAQQTGPYIQTAESIDYWNRVKYGADGKAIASGE